MMNALIEKIYAVKAGESVQLTENLYMFRIPKADYRHGQSYAITYQDEAVLIDCVHHITKEAVEKLMERYTVTGMILTHSDLIKQAFGKITDVRNWIDAPIYAHPDDYLGEPLENIMEASEWYERYNLSIYNIPGHTPGSIVIYQHLTERLFTGDSAVGNNYEKDGKEFSHPPISDDDWPSFCSAWNSISRPVLQIYPLHGKPDFTVSDFDIIKSKLTDPENVMQF
ncbi:MBL fold metallo-hydrolase [Limibacter armeniacum]|uniref:MBL fold metallo-hydrolase n=1 Tax=Limibacter armeniacum TaxID=466084 RepID=UPI002FE6901D